MLLKSEVSVSSGNVACLNDFVITNSADIKMKDIVVDESIAWSPTDDKKEACFSLPKCENAKYIVLYEKPTVSVHILDVEISLNEEIEIYTGELKRMGAPTWIELPQTSGIEKIQIKIVKWEGENPGLTEVEMYVDRETKLPETMALYDDSIKEHEVAPALEKHFMHAKYVREIILFPNHYAMRREYHNMGRYPIFLPVLWVRRWLGV